METGAGFRRDARARQNMAWIDSLHEAHTNPHLDIVEQHAGRRLAALLIQIHIVDLAGMPLDNVASVDSCCLRGGGLPAPGAIAASCG